MKAHVR